MESNRQNPRVRLAFQRIRKGIGVEIPLAGNYALGPGFKKNLESFYNKASTEDKARALELITAIDIGTAITQDQADQKRKIERYLKQGVFVPPQPPAKRRPKSAYPYLDNTENMAYPESMQPTLKLGPLSTSYKREFIPRANENVVAYRPKSTKNAYCQRFVPPAPVGAVGDTTYQEFFYEKPLQPAKPIRIEDWRNNPHPLEAPSNENNTSDKQQQGLDTEQDALQDCTDCSKCAQDCTCPSKQQRGGPNYQESTKPGPKMHGEAERLRKKFSNRMIPAYSSKDIFQFETKLQPQKNNLLVDPVITNPHRRDRKQAFMHWRFPHQAKGETAPSEWNRELTDDLMDAVSRGQQQTVYQSDYLGLPQGVKPPQMYGSLDPGSTDWRDHVPYTMDTFARTSWKTPVKQGPELEPNTTRYGCNKKKDIPSVGGVPNVSKRAPYMHLVGRTAYDHEFNDTAPQQARSVRDVGKHLNAASIMRYYKASDDPKEKETLVKMMKAMNIRPPPSSTMSPVASLRQNSRYRGKPTSFAAA